MKSESNTDDDEERDPELKADMKGLAQNVLRILVDEADNPKRRKQRCNEFMGAVRVLAQESGIKIDEAKKPQRERNVVNSKYSLRSGLKGKDVDLEKQKGKGKEKITEETDVEKVRKSIERVTLNAARKRKGKETETRDLNGDEADTEDVNDVVRNSYALRSKGIDVDLESRKRKGKEKKTDETELAKVLKRIKRETLSPARKRKEKETETLDFSGDEAETEEVCKRIRKDRNNDDDDADKDGAGSAGGYATRSSTRNMMVKSN